MISISSDIIKTFKNEHVKCRPNAGTGFWVSFLLPLAVFLPLVATPEILSQAYKLSIIMAAGLTVANIILLKQCIKHNTFKIGIAHYATTMFASLLVFTFLKRGIVFSLYSGLISTYSYYKCLPKIFRLFPQSFTFGEAALVTQSSLIFLYQASLNIFQSIVHTPETVTAISTLILQVGFTGIGIIALSTYKMPFFRRLIPFYTLTVFVVIFLIIFPLHILLNQSPVVWILQLLADKARTRAVILFWVVCSALAVFVINTQIRRGRRANSVSRKAFHILAVVVYITGILDQCSVLYLASGIIFAIFIAFEMLRILNLPPIGAHLQDAFVVFGDDKDAGLVALTPLYLFAGCSLPLWVHPESCDVTDSAGFNLLPLISGLLSIGVGDTLASVVGTAIGKHKWAGTSKTLEGTLACIISQFTFIYFLVSSGYIINNPRNVSKSVIAVILSSLVEAKTDQVDNIVLPLIMYIILY